MALSRARLVKEQDDLKRIEKIMNLKILKPGDAVNFPKLGDSCSVHYVGFLEDGTCFDNSYNRGAPVYFILGAGQVLRGWEEVLPILSRGEKARITVPSEYGYGDKGYPPIIPPKSVLYFEIELMSFSSIGNAERLHREKKAAEDMALALGNSTTNNSNNTRRK